MNTFGYSLQARVAFSSKWFRGKAMGILASLHKPLSDVEPHPNASQLWICEFGEMTEMPAPTTLCRLVNYCG